MTQDLTLSEAGTLAPAAPPVPWTERYQHQVGLAVFIGKRLAFGLLVLAVIVFVSFLGLEMARGADLSQAFPYAVKSSLAYFDNLLHGNLGYTRAGSLTRLPVPVSGVLANVVPKSLGLLAVSLLMATAVGVLLGYLAGRRRHGNGSLVFILLSIVGVSIPSFFAALLLQLLMVRLARESGSLPPLPVGGFGWDRHIVLPAVVLAARPVAQIARITFVTLGTLLGQDYIRTATGKGLLPRQIWSGHIWRNALIPILTTIGISLRFSLSSLPVVEYFFGWPGMGFTLLKSISLKDDLLTVALLLVMGILFIVANLALDLSYRAIDPQLRDSVSTIGRQEKQRLARRVRNVLDSLVSLLRYNELTDWFHQMFSRRSDTAAESPFAAVSAAQGAHYEVNADVYRVQRRRAWWRGTLGNLPLVLGGVILIALLALLLFGPHLTPHNPYTTRGLAIVNGEFQAPPFEPGADYPLGSDVLGRDIASLILAGAQQTLILAVLAVTARMLVGFVLGAIAGWKSGSWIDRLIMGAAEVLSAFPALVLAMLIVLAMGIRQGMQVFVVALCVVGWGETMLYVRGEVMTIRPKPYIESAVAVGVRTTRMMVAHVLPILLAALISLAALEMGAVLMLLGELGFIGIFIGGGAFAELDVGSTLYHYSDVPEWGSLLSSVRLYARSYPWVAIYPALAFFIAIVGFNLFGEGLRRMVETVGVGFGRIFNRYTVAVALVGLVGLGWVRANTGSVAYYRQQARTFDGQQALAQVNHLTAPGLEGRSLGSPGMDEAAGWIAQQFESLGLFPAGQDATFFQNRTREFTQLDAVTQLTVEDGGPALVYRRDFAEYAGHFTSIGEASGPLRAVLMGDLGMTGSFGGRDNPVLNKAVSKDDILLLLSEEDALLAEFAPHAALLVVASDPQDLQRHYTISGRNRFQPEFLTGARRGTNTPAVWISESTADRLLASTGETVASLRRQQAALGTDEVRLIDAGVEVSMTVSGAVVDRQPARHVIGYLPGVSGRTGDSGVDQSMPGGAAQDESAELDNKLVVVMAQYDSAPWPPDAGHEAANVNASGFAVMLEALRALQASGYQPYRSFLFVAYAGEGQEGGEPIRPGEVRKFLQARTGFSSAFEVEAVILLRGLGAGSGDGLVITAGGNQRLADLFDSSARRTGVDASPANDAVDISIVFEDRALRSGEGQEAPTVTLSWEGWQETARMPGDTAATISASKLEQAGEALLLSLMTLGREDNY